MWTTFWNNFQYTFARGSPFKKLLFKASIKFRNKYSIKCQKIRVCSKNKGTLFLWKNESIMEINNLSWILQFDNAVCKFKIFETINTTWPIKTCLIQEDRSEWREWKQVIKQIKVIFYKIFNITNKRILCILRWRTCLEFDGYHWWF